MKGPAGRCGNREQQNRGWLCTETRQEAKISSTLSFPHPLLAQTRKTFNILAKISYHKKQWKKQQKKTQLKSIYVLCPDMSTGTPGMSAAATQVTPKMNPLKGLGHFCPQIHAETHLAKGFSWTGTRQGPSSWVGSVNPHPRAGTPHTLCVTPAWWCLNNPGAKSWALSTWGTN